MSTVDALYTQKLKRSVFHAIRKYLVNIGYLPDILLYQALSSTQNYINYNLALKAIRDAKGFAIEVFNHNGNLKRANEKIPRISVNFRKTDAGDIGGDSRPFYQASSVDDYDRPTSYTSIRRPDTYSVWTFDIYLSAETSDQFDVLHSVVANVLPKRGYIPIYPDSEPILNIVHFGSYQMPTMDMGITEYIYIYEMRDIYEPSDVIGGEVSPINDISLDLIIESLDNSQNSDEINLP